MIARMAVNMVDVLIQIVAVVNLDGLGLHAIEVCKYVHYM